jgi:kynurenine formamidase
MGKVKLVDLSQPFGHGSPLWPYFQEVKIERMHYHAANGVFTQWLHTPMHCSTHADSPIHVLPANQLKEPMYTADLPLEKYYGTGVIVSIPKKRWEVITAKDLEKATPKIKKGDIVIINSGWHHKFGDNTDYFCYSPGLYKEAGEWFVDKGVKAVGVDQQALDHPLATAIGFHGPGPLRPDVCEEYEKVMGRSAKDDFPLWEPCHKILLGNGVMGWENVGGDLDKVTGKRVTIAGFPIRWVGGDGSMVRLVAIVDG